MNKYAIISLVVIFIVLIILKVNFFWLAVLAIAAAYFVRKHLQSVKQENTNEEVHKKADKLDIPNNKISSKEEEN
ncbi:hypothetical protein HNS38_11690 [Lentimicrobium sp. L6]|uniref:hypothetical protein n=1 Tax=Lentimicrobium sp. L6 TaxID=2735916 RepID=UPI0015521DD6|nr:hypothetical protein [Lentimicrobium sp. L6]NPD85428.1 hypothetical protein [Lentimicrobium sp. L6]